MLKFSIGAAAAALAFAMPASATILTYGAPGEVTSTNPGALSVETFNSHTPTGPYATTSFTDVIGGITFDYTGVSTIADDQFSGDSHSTYAGVYNGPYGGTNVPYTLNVSSASLINYFGLYVSAADSSNTMTFYRGTHNLGDINLGAIRNAIGVADQGAFFANFYFSGNGYDKVVFSQPVNCCGFESDNHTVGKYQGITGMYVTGSVPEPITWGMMVVGFGAMGAMTRRRRATTLTA